MHKAFLVLFLAAALPVQAQTAREVLGKSAAQYRDAQEYHLQGDLKVSMESDGQERTMDLNLLLAERKPDFINAVIVGPAVQMRIVSDGQNTWMYIPSMNQYMKQDGPFNADMANSPVPNLVHEYAGMADSVASASLLPEETVRIAGEDRPAYVVKVEYTDRATIPGPDMSTKTLWIDKARFVVLRDETSSIVQQGPQGRPVRLDESARFSVMRVGEPVADSLFVFTPPEGATEVAPEEALGDKRASDGLVGKPAEGFLLSGLDGVPVSLEALKGRVVLVNLWATWCGPCRHEMPDIEALHREFADKGLMVLAVDVAEEAADVDAYIREHGYTFKVLLDSDGAVANQYRADGIPTSLIIDREGAVTHHFVGARTGREFREALKEVGIE